MSRPRGSKNKPKANRAELFGQSLDRATMPAYRTAGAIQPPPPLTNAQLFEELGSSGLTRFGGTVYEEFIKELRLKGAPQTYKEMRENSPVISAILFAIEMSLRRVKFYFEPPDDKDHELSDFLDGCLEDMSTSWQDTLSQILTMLQFGFSIHELVYKVRKGLDKSPESKYDDGRIGWRKWLPLAQETLAPGREWIWDETGGVQGINQIAPPDYILRTLPIEKVLLFRTSVAKNNPEGRSLLRSMYIPWYYAKNFSEIEGIAMERQGCGIPVMYMGYDTAKQGAQSDTEFAKQVVRDVRADEQEGVVIPYPKMTGDGKGMLFEIVSATGGARTLDFDKVISRYEKRMAMSCLAEFIMLGMENVGSYALSKDSTDMFILSNTAWAEIICQVIMRHAVPRLLKLNTFKYDEMPQLKHSEINVPDLVALSEYVNKLVGANLLVPDDNLQKYLREAAHLPDIPEGAPTIQDMQRKAEAGKQAQLAALQQAQQAKTEVPSGNGNGNKQDQPKGTAVEAPKPGESPNPGAQAPARGMPKGTTEKASEEFQVQTRRAYGGAKYETATNEYQGQLEAIYADWQDSTSKKLANEQDETVRNAILTAALAALLVMLIDAGRAGLLGAMQIGASGALSPNGLATLQQLVTTNETWLENSLIPAIDARARLDMHDPAFMLGGVAALTATLGVFTGRVASYAGGFWNAIFNGIGDAIAEDPNGDNLKVERVLDDNAKHCNTCPDKAGIYENWDDMVARAGIPGDGSDTCYANCRCTLKIETAPGSGVFERFSAGEQFGGLGSGNAGHAGRPGEVGGSGPGGGSDKMPIDKVGREKLVSQIAKEYELSNYDIVYNNVSSTTIPEKRLYARYDPVDVRITVFPEAMKDQKSLRGIIAHEVTHLKLDRSGLVRHLSDNAINELAKAGGITPYSSNFWKWARSPQQRAIAVEETLAEISRLRSGSRNYKAPRVWEELYAKLK